MFQFSSVHQFLEMGTELESKRSPEIASQLLEPTSPEKSHRPEGKGKGGVPSNGLVCSDGDGQRLTSAIESLALSVTALNTMLSNQSSDQQGFEENVGDGPDDILLPDGEEQNKGNGKMPKFVRSAVLESFAEWKTSLDKHIRNQKQLGKLRQQVMALERGEMPAGLPRYKCAFECAELDEVLQPFAHTAGCLTLALDAPIRLREAKEKLFSDHLLLSLKFDVLIAERREKNFKDILEWSALEKSVGDKVDPLLVMPNFGLSIPAVESDKTSWNPFLNDLYSKHIRQLKAADVTAEVKESKLRKEREDLAERVAKLDPEKIIELKVQQAVKASHPHLKSNNYHVKFNSSLADKSYTVEPNKSSSKESPHPGGRSGCLFQNLPANSSTERRDKRAQWFKGLKDRQRARGKSESKRQCSVETLLADATWSEYV